MQPIDRRRRRVVTTFVSAISLLARSSKASRPRGSGSRRAARLAVVAAAMVALGRPGDTAAQITEFSVPTSNSGLWGITVGPDGALWFTEADGSKIGRITTAGMITEFPMMPI